MGEFPHQIRFRQPLPSRGERGLQAYELSQEAALLGIEVQFEYGSRLTTASFVLLGTAESEKFLPANLGILTVVKHRC